MKSLSRVRPSATPWTAAYQAPPIVLCLFWGHLEFLYIQNNDFLSFFFYIMSIPLQKSPSTHMYGKRFSVPSFPSVLVSYGCSTKYCCCCWNSVSSHGPRGCKSKTKVVTRLRPSWNLEGRVLCASSSGTGCPGSWLCSPSCLCLLLLHCSPLSASHPSVTRFRTILLYQDLILTSPVCNTPISRLSSVPK